MNKNRNSIIFIFFLMLISVFIICCVKYFGKNSCFNDDDFFYARYMIGESYFNSFKFSSFHGGGYLGLFLCKFLSFGLPCLLNIHPDDFICNQGGIIRGIFTCFILFSISLFSIIRNKSKLLYLVSFLFITFYYFNCEFIYFTSLVNYNFYRYFFSLLFFSIFWYFIYSDMLRDKKESKINYFKLFLVCISGFIVGTSSEINFFVSSFLVILIIIYNLISKKNRFNLNINFYLPITFFFLGMTNFVLSSGFREVAADRGMADIHITFEGLKEYTALYLDVCFLKNYYYWIFFIILLILSLIFCYRKKLFKDIIFPIFFQISLLTVMYSLVLCGKTFGEVDYFLCHHNIIFLYRMLIMYPILILFDYVLKNIYETVKYKQVFLRIVCVLILVSLICMNINFINKIKIHSNVFYKYKKETYMCQKIVRYYYLKKETIKIPQSFIFDLPLDSEIHANIYKNSLFKIYKDNGYININFMIVPNGLEVFFKDGGRFSENELKELKFARLYDDDFVLGK